MSPQLWNHPNVSVMWKCKTSGFKHILVLLYRLLHCLVFIRTSLPLKQPDPGPW